MWYRRGQVAPLIEFEGLDENAVLMQTGFGVGRDRDRQLGRCRSIGRDHGGDWKSNPVVVRATECGPVYLDPDRVVRLVPVVVPDPKEESVSGILEGQSDPDLGVRTILPPVGHLFELARLGPIIGVDH